MLLYNHVTAPLSELERRMIAHVPPGGNWKDIPIGLSARVDQIHERSKTRGPIHTTYYGRLRWDAPSYTISTFFSRSGNGCFIHPEQGRLISAREAARLQSFPDKFVFCGPQRSIDTQIGNAVPPLLGFVLGGVLPGERVVDLFAGAGGLSYGLGLAGKEVVLAVESNKHAARTYAYNHPGAEVWETSLGTPESISDLADRVRERGGCDILVGGPPCQSFSTAGRRASDTRSTLVATYVETVRAIRPETFLMENVLGLRSFQHGQLLRQVVQDLMEMGYDVGVWDLRAEQYGIPQRRRRLFVAGSLVQRLSAPQPISPLSMRMATATVSVYDAISDLPPLEVGGASHLSTPIYLLPSAHTRGGCAARSHPRNTCRCSRRRCGRWMRHRSS